MGQDAAAGRMQGSPPAEKKIPSCVSLTGFFNLSGFPRKPANRGRGPRFQCLCFSDLHTRRRANGIQCHAAHDIAARVDNRRLSGAGVQHR